MQEVWNKKFSRDGLLYGKDVNVFIKALGSFVPKQGRILCLGEGEGRNAIYFAKKGLHVEALDASDVGLKKLQERANEENVAITIRHTLIENWQPYGEYDTILSTFTHLPRDVQKQMFEKSISALKSGGFFLAEFFSVDQINYDSGGPKDTQLLYKLDELYALFTSLPCTIVKLCQELTELSEGKGHNGEASVIRIVLKKH